VSHSPTIFRSKENETVIRLGEFGDAFLEGTGLDGGSVPPSLAVFSLVLDRTLQEQKPLLSGFDHADMQHLDAINEIFKDAKALSRKVLLYPHGPEVSYHLHQISYTKFALVMSNSGGSQLIHFLRGFTKQVKSVKVLLFCTLSRNEWLIYFLTYVRRESLCWYLGV